MRETIFLTIANNLPRSRLADRFRHVLCALAGMRIKDRCMIWGPLTIALCLGLLPVFKALLIALQYRFRHDEGRWE